MENRFARLYAIRPQPGWCCVCIDARERLLAIQALQVDFGQCCVDPLRPPLFATSLTKSVSSRVFSSCFLFLSHTLIHLRSPAVFSDGRCAAILEFLSLSNLRARFVSLHRLGVTHQTSLRSRATMMMYSNSPQWGEAGSLFTLIRSLRCRTTVAIRHPRMDTPAFLPRLSATAELLVINLVTHHDPESDPEFSGCCDSGFPQPFLHQFASVEAFQLRIPLDRVYRRLTPQITQ